jgi:hypothetical protein
LYYLGVTLVPEGIQKQGEDNRDREPGSQAVYTEDKGIPDDKAGIRGIEKPDEVLKPNPGASPYTAPCRIRPKSYLRAVKGPVMEDQGDEDTGQTEQIQVFVCQNLYHSGLTGLF